MEWDMSGVVGLESSVSCGLTRGGGLVHGKRHQTWLQTTEHQKQYRRYFIQIVRSLAEVHSNPATHHVPEERRLLLWTDKVTATMAVTIVFESTTLLTLT